MPPTSPSSLPTEDVEPGTTTAARHSDSKLQTRLTPDRLQKKLLTLYRDAQTLEEEQGISVLFLALGFLRWYESDSSQTERFAPLILLPVDLERSSTRGRFRLIFRDQDLEPNLSLRALLSNDFGLTLPDFPEGDEWLPSDYFGRVQEAVESMARWARPAEHHRAGILLVRQIPNVEGLGPGEHFGWHRRDRDL